MDGQGNVGAIGCQMLCETTAENIDGKKPVPAPSADYSAHYGGKTNSTYNDGAPQLENYKILSLIGSGTFGGVYKAFDIKNRRVVAIKQMKARMAEDMAEYLPEVKILNYLPRHPNIIPMYEVLQRQDTVYIVSEFLDGGTLLDLQTKCQALGLSRLSERVVRIIARQIFEGIAHFHHYRVCHRDLKLENILVSGSFEVPEMLICKITDFGLGKIVPKERENEPFTNYISSRWYRPPSQMLRGRYSSGPECVFGLDVWAAGCIVCEMLAGKPLFPGVSEPDMLSKICDFFRIDINNIVDLQYDPNIKIGLTPQEIVEKFMKFTGASEEACQFLRATIAWSVKERITAKQALAFEFLN